MSPDELLSSYDYELPRELIAREPAAQRDGSRLMLLDRRRERIEHRQFQELPQLLAPGDLLVVNDTRVIPARLAGVRTSTGGRWEGLFLGLAPHGDWRIIGQARGRLVPGETIRLSRIHSVDADAATNREFRGIPVPPAERAVFGDSLELELLSKDEGGIWTVRPRVPCDPFAALSDFGTVPLPPYMGRDAAEPGDWERYQTTYAQHPGAVAAPTAGLHFTPEVFEHCRERGIGVARVTLHVGPGTFRPVQVEQLADHHMHGEWCELPKSTVTAIRQTRTAGGRVIPVGTTSVRTLESAAQRGELSTWQGETRLFIRPPYTFQMTDALITNFHLPKSTLLVLVSALAGREFVLRAYHEAIRERYRFFSYGDAMLIV